MKLGQMRLLLAAGERLHPLLKEIRRKVLQHRTENTLLRSKDDILFCDPRSAIRDPEVKGQIIDHVTYYVVQVNMYVQS